LFAYTVAKSDAPYHGAPYWSISVNFILLDRLFRK
jgi:hypothetical protein